MSNHQTHLDAAKQVCLTALRHLDHGCVVAVKQHSGSVVDEPGEPARIILTLELEALDLPATNNDHQDDKTDIPPIYLEGYLLEMAKRRVVGEMFGPKPITEDWFKDEGRAGRLATGEESGGESLHAVKDAEGEGRMVMGPLEVGVVKVPALDKAAIKSVLKDVLFGSANATINRITDRLLQAQEKSLRGDE